MESIQPLFICLGVPKAATTWIHRQLEAHPDVGTTLSKEINYWNSNYARGPEWYRKQFPNDRDYEVYAEVAAGYLRDTVIERLAAGVPSARFMVSLRNPYERSWSSYWQSVRTGDFSGGLEEAIAALPKIIEDSLYSPGLTAFMQHFPRDRLHVALYDHLAINARSFIREIYEFAGAEPDFVPPGLEKPVNRGRRHSKADETVARVQKVVKKMGLKRGHLVKLGLWPPLESIYALLAESRPIPDLGEREWDTLDERLYPEVQQLEELLDRDLSLWRVRP